MRDDIAYLRKPQPWWPLSERGACWSSVNVNQSMEDAAAASSGNLESLSKLSPRGYQWELLMKARERNIIVCLETGCGKTLIAAMLLKELSCTFSSSTPFIAVFLVPTVILVQQQASAIEKFTGLMVGQYNGQNDSMRWHLEKWKHTVYDLEVLVMTPQSLLNLLQHAMLTFEIIKVLVFDECHHCQKNHPYALIMENFYFKTEICHRPRILGMTASPVIRKGKSEFQCTQDIQSLERMLDAKIVTVEDRSELDLIVPSPSIQIKEYNKVYQSLDRLQSVMGILNTLKEKKKMQKELGRICRDLEYCIFDLGLWFARHVASDCYISERNSTQIYGSTTNEEKNSYLRNAYECLHQTILQGGYGDQLGVDSMKPDLVSNKVASLVEVLVNFRYSKPKCIVFVERVVAAKVVAHFLSEVLKPLRCEHIVGQHLKVGGSSRSLTSKTLSDFRSGLVDLLVATNVAEEGLDIQDCSLIVQFDKPKTLRSFIQSRGRARVQSSHYVILKDRNNISEDELLDTLISKEKFVIKKILHGNNQLTESKSREKGDVYEVKSTGAIVTSHSSVQLLHHYCSKLPSDQFHHPQPSFVYVKELFEVKCFLTLPSNACIRLVEGELCESEAAAKRAACLKACKILHSKGALTDYLLPPTSIKDGKADALLNPRDPEAEMEELQEPIIPEVWFQRPPTSFDVIALHAYKISFNAELGDRDYSNFALMMRSPLPQGAANLSEKFQLRQGRAVFCKLETLRDVCLNPVQVAKAEEFQSALFSVLLDRTLEHSQSKERLLEDGPWYLIVPLEKDRQLGFDQDPEIDWERISKLKPFGGSQNVINVAESASLKVDGTALQFSNGVLNKDNVPGLLVRTLHSRKLYCIIEIFNDLDAECPFPNSRYKNYVEYFRSMYNHELVARRQHLLKARFLREAHNFLLNRSTKAVSDLQDGCSNDVPEHSLKAQKPMEEPERSIVELPPEVCSIVYCGFYDDLVNAAVILPSLMHRIESILVATQFRTFLGSKFPEGSRISVEKVMEAITTQKCLDYSSLERLELLGDSFLKYAISCNLFLVHEEADEGFLSMKRIEKVCNSTLFTLGKNIGLIEYIRDSLFDPKHWVAPCYPSKVLCNKSKVTELHGKSSKDIEGKPFVVCTKRHRWMQRKTVADAIEALIGAYLEDGGEHPALAFMKFIGMEVAVNTLQIARVQSLSENNLSLIKKIDIEAIERLLSYNFRHKGILIEAFTHASFSNHLGKCYQRLEFLGDSVLDFLITKQLYREFRDSNPGELTDLRATIVSNESFARIVIERKLYSYLIQNSVVLSKCINEFITSQYGITGDWEGDKCPKVLGDILESLSGAVLVDGGFKLSCVWEVFEPILQPLISARKIQFHPVRELLELCQHNHLACKESREKNDNRIQFTFKIDVKNHVVQGAAVSKDKRSAKRQAALDALAKLEALGYVHPSRSKTQGFQKMSNLPYTPSKKISVETEKKGDLESIGNSITPNVSSGFLLQDSGSDIDMGIRDVFETKSEPPLKIESSEATKTETNPGRTPMAVISYDFETKNDDIETKNDDIQKGHEQDNFCSYVKNEYPRHIGPSQHTRVHQHSSVSLSDGEGPLWAHFGQVNVSDSSLGGCSEQSIEKAPGTSVKMSWLVEGHGPCIEKEFESLCLSSPNKAANLADAKETKSRGHPRAELYEACAKKRWEHISFICTNEEGPPHDKWFTYQVVLQLPHVGEVHCTGDSRKTTKAAMDSAAEELLHWLRTTGHL